VCVCVLCVCVCVCVCVCEAHLNLVFPAAGQLLFRTDCVYELDKCI